MRCSICGVEYRGDGIHACPFTTQYWPNFPEFGKSMANQAEGWSKAAYYKYDTEQYWRTIIAAEILSGY